jgi:hypothetical protein
VDTTRAICGPDATLQDYLCHLIPRRWIGNNEGGTTLLHKLQDLPCSTLGCTCPSILDGIETAWPNILNISPETLSCTTESFTRQALPLPRSFTVNEDVRYELVGRTHFDRIREHFTCDRPILERLYESNDMLFDGDFVDVGSVDQLQDVDFTVQLLVYCRVSDCKVCTIFLVPEVF